MNWKVIAILVALLLLLIFVLQNHAVVEIKFFFWVFTASRAIILFLTLVIGILIGLVVPYVWRE